MPWSQRHLECWVGTRQKSLARGEPYSPGVQPGANTRTGVWPTGLLAATQPCLMLRSRGASPRAFSILPSPTFPPTGRILETWEHTDFHSHTQTHMLGRLVRLPALHSMSRRILFLERNQYVRKVSELPPSERPPIGFSVSIFIHGDFLALHMIGK